MKYVEMDREEVEVLSCAFSHNRQDDDDSSQIETWYTLARQVMPKYQYYIGISTLMPFCHDCFSFMQSPNIQYFRFTVYKYFLKANVKIKCSVFVGHIVILHAFVGSWQCSDASPVIGKKYCPFFSQWSTNYKFKFCR